LGIHNAYSRDAETLDVGVRLAARNLVRFAHGLATEAAELDPEEE
jgi:hypothetical protein